MPPTQQFFGGMAANQTTFDGQAVRNQVAYAFKNRSMAVLMVNTNQYQQGMMGGCMGQMGQMGQMGGMQPMYGGMMGGMNYGPWFGMNNDNNDVSSSTKKRKKIKTTVDIDLSQESMNENSSNVSDEE